MQKVKASPPAAAFEGSPERPPAAHLCPPAGGRGTLRLQVRLQPRGALLHGLPGKPKALPEGGAGRRPALQRGGGPPPARIRGGGALPGGRGGAMHADPNLPRHLPKLELS